jgi:chorismate synthase
MIATTTAIVTVHNHPIAHSARGSTKRPITSGRIAISMMIAISGTATTPLITSNHADGISTGQPILARFAVKPTSSILTPSRTVNRRSDEMDITMWGRHDLSVGIRAVPVGEAMMANVLADHLLRQRAQNPDAPAQTRLPRN